MSGSRSLLCRTADEADDLLPGGLQVVGAFAYVAASAHPSAAAERLRTLLSPALPQVCTVPCSLAERESSLFSMCRSGAQDAAPFVAAAVSPAAVAYYRLTPGAAEPMEAEPVAASGGQGGSCSAAEWLAASCKLFRCRLPLQLQVTAVVQPCVRRAYGC